MSSLIGRGEPQSVAVEREHLPSRFLVTCDHAHNRIPKRLGTLGLSSRDLQRHIALDIGARGVAQSLSTHLDATAVYQNYSRLVVDCNRPLDRPQLIPEKSEATEIPGNRGLSAADRRARVAAIFDPYHDRITRLLDDKALSGCNPILVAVHSFTPVYHGESRPWQIGILYRNDPRLAKAILAELREDRTLCVGDNQPYRIDQDDYGIPVHGEARGIRHVLLEIRQDLITDSAGQAFWAERLAGAIAAAVS